MLLNFIRGLWTTKTTEFSPWRPLAALRDRSLPKLDNLRRAAQAGLPVPEPTMWAFAHDLDPQRDLHLPALVNHVGLPCIVRSISPTEDTAQSSQAGQFLSVVVNNAQALPHAVAQVTLSLPVDQGRRQGAIAVQPFLVNPRAGVTFFDGFYFEESVLSGQNTGVTSGRRRGRVERGYVMRGEPRSRWLAHVYQLLGGPVNVEWTETKGGQRILLQARPALFPVKRNETLSLANNKETLGDLPSPWIVGVYSELGHPVLDLARRADPSLPDWKDPYAVSLAGRTWVNFSSLFRLMDRWGLPRTLVCQTLGGASNRAPRLPIHPPQFSSFFAATGSHGVPLPRDRLRSRSSASPARRGSRSGANDSGLVERERPGAPALGWNQLRLDRRRQHRGRTQAPVGARIQCPLCHTRHDG